MKTIIKTDKLCKTFSTGGVQQHVIKNMDLEIKEGDFTILMGSSGSGKSTLLYALSGMDQPSMGKIYFGEQEISTFRNDQLALFRRMNCGFVFQNIYLLDNMNVLDNILTNGLLVSEKKKEIVSRAKQLLLRVGLTEEDFKKFPASLSGGEAQRVGIVRALINQPKIVFADEPTGALNSASGKDVLDVFTEVNQTGQSIVMVTHDVKTALRGNRILYMKDGTIQGELHLEAYTTNNLDARRSKVQYFLDEMGW
ncbi:ABC transporter ATP-binding protein [Anaerosporobacter faecicola]|uniref:ABC transporter ATP-binding protein n=1 Tax=Anaerosporobacter faecicola TaxID=2718714 RepID=UPI001438D9C9|nr:ABC transporter ATP-binding protein [Anaerosporobacter faecicola]